MASVRRKTCTLAGTIRAFETRKNVEAADISAHTIRGRNVLHPNHVNWRKETRGRNNTCTIARTFAACRAFGDPQTLEVAVITAPGIPRGRDVSTAPDVVLRPFSVK